MTKDAVKIECDMINRMIKANWETRKFLIKQMEGANPELKEWLTKQTIKEHVRQSKGISI